ncbi:MarR family winged helix-turn-helix transcriptional regulator [Micromonospora foliorum]|uniref:MarR family winged helix-turn-helix transcriptional regulator n=1 Tax=Micromonospora foliorum TaxID=2911210 RepID=UPI001EE8FC89|nr:MarR family winged helix-turn-helix transcriptional regulator [Micromonospora foliorum]MCG5439588.1 MarR family winged helix-turn-helix transcriptional regulator [Micromonospora foliorum]
MTERTQDRVDAYRLLMADVYELAGESRRSSEQLAQEEGQTAARWHVLSVLSDGSRTVASAARRLGLARQSVQRVVDDLARAGMVELHDNPDHRRAPLVRLTEAGLVTLTALLERSDVDRRDAVDRAGLSLSDLENARATLRRLVDALRSR